MDAASKSVSPKKRESDIEFMQIFNSDRDCDKLLKVLEQWPGRGRGSGALRGRGESGLVIGNYESLLLAAPEGDVVPHQLQDHRALLVVLLVDGVDVRDRLLERPVRQLHSPLPLLPHLPQEDGGVEVQREAHWVGLREVGPCDLLGLGVVGAGLFEVVLARLVVLGVLAEVAVEVGQHLAEEDDGLCALDVVLVGDHFLLEQFDQVVAHLRQLLLDLPLVLLQALPHPLLLTHLTAHRLHHLQLCPSRADHALVGRRAEVAFGGGQFFLRQQDLVREGQHLLIAFRLLGQLRQQHVVLLLEVLPLHHYNLNHPPTYTHHPHPTTPSHTPLPCLPFPSPLPTIISLKRINMNSGQSDKSAFSVAIQLGVRSASTAVRFPCLFSVQWRTNNQKVSVETGKYGAQGGRTDFNEQLLMRTEVAFDRATRRFLKKETQVQLNLISKSRPDQSKLVGRVTVDLAAILNDGLYAQPTDFPLQFCSVNASLVMAFRVLEQVESELSISELELSMGEGPTLSSALRLASGPGSVKEQPREGVEVSLESAAVSKNRADLQQVLKRETSPSPSPVSVESRTTPQAPPKKELPKEAPQLQDQKPATRSFKSIADIKESVATRKSEPTEDLSQQLEGKEQSKKSSFKKMGSISSEEGRFNESGRMSEDLSKQKLQNDRVRMEADRFKQEAELYRLQLEKVKQEYELTKLELKQKKSTADQSATEVVSLKNEMARTREELSRSREESVSLTLKLAELREAHNKSLVQATVTERELGKLEGVSQKLQSLAREREELKRHGLALEAELADYQSRCEQLQLEKTDLKATLNNLDQMHQEALSKCTEHEEALSQNRGSFDTEIRVLREQLKQETRHRMEVERQVQQLNEEVERLLSVASEFEEARHSWQITEALGREEAEHRNTRIRQLEENLMSLDERVRWLEGENELLTDNARKNREECLKVKTEKEIQGDTSAEEIRRYGQAVQELREEKQQLESELSTLQDLINRLQQQYDELKSGNDCQSETILQLQTSLAEVAVKNHELEELVLNINQLRDRQKQDSAQKEMGFVVRVAELEGSNRQLEELVQANAERVAVVEEELRGREGLIVRLQEGLRTQVERSEQLNNRVMHFLQKEERMKETLLLLELESRRVMELLADQEARETQTQQAVQQLEGKNAELVASLQESLKYGKNLQEIARSNETSAGAKIASLAKEIEKKSLEIAQNKLTIESKNIKIKDVEEQYVHLQAQSREASFKQQNAIDNLKGQVAELDCTLQAVEAVLAEKTSRLQEVEGELEQKHRELTDRLASIDRQTADFERLCGQLKEIQLNHQREIQESEERYLEIHSKYQDLENASSLNNQKQSSNITLLEQEVSELKEKLDAMGKENTTLAIAALKKEIKQKNELVKGLEGELKIANSEASKVANLQRSLKIKSIELNSLKFKGKNDGHEGSQLLRLKDEEISALTAEKDRLLANESELEMLRDKSEALATELQLIEEEKFNIESQSNERALQLEEARDQNRKLMDEITIIGERNSELQLTIQELLSKEVTKGSVKGQAALKAEITLLRGQLRELQQARVRVSELEESRKKMQEEIQLKEQEHMIALIDQQFKLAKGDSQNSNGDLKKNITLNNHDSKKIPNLNNAYKSLKEIIQARTKGKDHEKLVGLIQSILSHNEQNEGVLLEKSRTLSKQFQKLKVQIMKFDGKAGQQRLKLINLFKAYEAILVEVVRLSEGGQS